MLQSHGVLLTARDVGEVSVMAECGGAVAEAVTMMLCGPVQLAVSRVAGVSAGAPGHSLQV